MIDLHKQLLIKFKEIFKIRNRLITGNLRDYFILYAKNFLVITYKIRFATRDEGWYTFFVKKWNI